MRQFFRMLLLALVLMTVALISALTAMQLAIHGREVAIPKLVGMSPLEAERAGAASGLQVVIERQFYSADVPEGKIMTQMPPPGTKVRRGWSVRVAQSLGPQRVAIPGVTGGSERVAELNIRSRSCTSGAAGSVWVRSRASICRTCNRTRWYRKARRRMRVVSPLQRSVCWSATVPSRRSL